jgi:WD40 repeat protein
VSSLAFAPDSKRFVSGGLDRTVRLWDVAKGKGLRNFDGHTEMVQSVAFSPDGKQILSGGADNTLRVWNADSGEALRTLAEAKGSVNGVAYLPGGRYAVSGSGGEFSATAGVGSVKLNSRMGKEQAVRLWDLQIGKEVHVFEGPTFGVTGVSVSADGRRVFASSGNGMMHVWEIPEVKSLP